MPALKSPWLPSIGRGAVIGVPPAAALNLIITAAGLGRDPPGAPYPGPVNTLIDAIVPFVWVVLFAAMGTAIVRLRQLGPEARLAVGATVGLLVNCTLYPVYTLGFSSMQLGLAGNVFTAILAAFAAGAAARASAAAALLVSPVIVWVSLASIGLVARMIGKSF